MFLYVLASAFIIFHKNIPQIFDKLYFCLLRISGLVEFCFKYLLYFFDKVCFWFNFSDD